MMKGFTFKQPWGNGNGNPYTCIHNPFFHDDDDDVDVWWIKKSDQSFHKWRYVNIINGRSMVDFNLKSFFSHSTNPICYFLIKIRNNINIILPMINFYGHTAIHINIKKSFSDEEEITQ